MSPRAAAEFSRQWPSVERRLRAFLRTKGVVANEIDDVVQEVATRLLTFWHKVDRSRSVWPLTATIALNLLRDRNRRRDAEVLGEPPDLAGPFDAAQLGIAKLELAEVLRAMDELTPSQRDALLKAIESTGDLAPSTSSEKMLRMRARRRLANAVGRASAGLSLKLRRTGDALSALFSRSDGVAQALACATCLFVTTAGAASMYPPTGNLEDSQPRAVVDPTLERSTGGLGSADSFSPYGSEKLSPQRVSSGDTRATQSTARSTRANISDDEAPSGTTTSDTTLPLAQAPVPGSAPLATNAIAEPSPEAPDQPTEPPSVQPEASLPEESPVQAAPDAPLTAVEEVADSLTR